MYVHQRHFFLNRHPLFRFGLFCFLLFQSFMMSGQSAEARFEEGNAAYNNGNYEQAIASYESILEEGMHSAAVYFNIANAYYRVNAVAESIYFYEKAKQLNPDDADIDFNMQFSRNMTIDAIEALPKSQLVQVQYALLNWTNADGWGTVAIGAIWIACFFLFFYVLFKTPFYKRLFFSLMAVSFLITIISVSLAFLNNYQQKTKAYAILFSEKINVRSEPNNRSEVQFELHEGTKVLVLDALQEWQKIQIANGSEGWVKNAALRSLNSP